MKSLGSLSDTIANVATIGAAAAVLAFVAPQLKDRWNGRGARAPVVERVHDVTIQLPSARKGHSDARVALVEFSDFQCPYCGRYAREIEPALEQQFIATGKVLYGFRNLPLDQIHPMATNAGVAALCAQEQASFWPMHDDLFRSQQDLSVESLYARANKLSLDAPRFKACMGEASLAGDLDEAKRLGINSTPSFAIGVIDGRGSISVKAKIRGAQPVAVFASAIEEVARSRTN